MTNYCLEYCILISCKKHACETHEPHKSTAIWGYKYKCYARVYFFNISVYITSNLLQIYLSLLHVNILPKSENVKNHCFEFYKSPTENQWNLTDITTLSIWISQIFTDSSVKKIFLTVKSVNFHWNNQWNLTDLQ